MKSRDEMVSSLLERREQYENERAKRKKAVNTAIPVCCVCFTALLCFGMWFGKTTPDNTETAPPNNNKAPAAQSNDAPFVSDSQVDYLGTVTVNGANYIQCSTGTKIYTPDKYLGVAADFEGTFQMEPDAKLFTVTEDSDMLLVKLENGDYMFLRRQKN